MPIIDPFDKQADVQSSMSPPQATSIIDPFDKQEIETKVQQSQSRQATFDPFSAAFGEPEATERTQAIPAIGKAMGFDKALDPISRALARLSLPEDLKGSIPEPKWSEIGGGTLQIGSLFVPYGKIAGLGIKYGSKIAPEMVAKIVSTMGTGALGGYMVEAGGKMVEGEDDLSPGIVTAAGAAFPAIPAILKKAIPKPLTTTIKAKIKEGFAKGVKPYVSPKGQSATQRIAYYEKAEDAVESIISNKQNLIFSDDAGNVVKGELPKNLEQFQDAIHQTKTNIFRIYDYMAKKAGKKGAIVDLAPIINDLSEIAKDRVLKAERPEVIRYVNSKIAEYRGLRDYSTVEAQRAITILNDSLNAFRASPSYGTASRAWIDSLVVNKLRAYLDDAIDKLTGPGYQALKNKYGSLKAIERDVSRRVVTDLRKPAKGLVENITDVSSTAAVIHGLMSMSSKTIAASGGAKVVVLLKKKLQDPNRYVANMFSKVDSLYQKSITAAEKQALKIKRPIGDVGAFSLAVNGGEEYQPKELIPQNNTQGMYINPPVFSNYKTIVGGR